MPLIGLALGSALAHGIGQVADYLAAAAVVGAIDDSQFRMWVLGFGVPPYGERRSWCPRRAGESWFRGRAGGGQADGRPAVQPGGDRRGVFL